MYECMYVRGVSEMKYEFLRQRRKGKDRKRIFFNVDVANSNTLLVSLELIMVSAGEVVLDYCGGDPFQPGLTSYFQVNPIIIMMSGFQKGSKSIL